MNRARYRHLTLRLGRTLPAALAVAVPLVVAAQRWATVERHFIRGEVTSHGQSIPYVVCLPEGYSPRKRWPVTLFVAQPLGLALDAVLDVPGPVVVNDHRHLAVDPHDRVALEAALVADDGPVSPGPH